MSNQKSKKNTHINKRPAFLPADVRKEFGCYVKKPRLDVRLTPSTSHSPNKSTLNSSQKDSADEIWEDGFPEEEVIEEYDILITQAYEEGNVTTSVSDNTTASVKQSTSSNHKPSTSRNVSNGICKTSNRVPSCTSSNQKNEDTKFPSRLEEYPKVSNTLNNVKRTFIPSFPAAEKESRNVENENKELKEKIVQKEGEVAILRNQLKQLQEQLDTQKLNHCKSLETQAQKFMKQLNEQRKELDVTNTQLQFQIMEATSMRNHCKVLESGSKIKLVEPQSISAETPKKKKESLRDDDQRRAPLTISSIASPSNCGRFKKSDKSCGYVSLNINGVNPAIYVREGSVFGLLVNEYLTAKSQQDVSWILYLRKKQSLCRKIKEAESINSQILNLQKTNQTLESCYSAVNKLITLNVISSTAASFFIEMIVKECQKIICRQMHILYLLTGVQSYTERGTLNGIVASVIGTPATPKQCHLMDAGQWYEGEEGIEARRALGLLSALCNISSLASDLTYGSKELTINDERTNKINFPDHTRDVAGPSNKLLTAITVHEMSENRKTMMLTTQKKDKVPYMEYIAKPFGFLHLLRDITFSICFQRRTRHFVGVLTGIVNLLTAVARSTYLTQGGLDIVSQVIREVVFCRPQIEVVVALFELLSTLSSYQIVMKLLCINSGNRTFIDKRRIGLTYFTRESCVTQVLFRLLPMCATSVLLRTELCYHMVDWLYTVVCFSGKESCWILTVPENKRVMCNCRVMLATGLVTTLYNSLCDLDFPKLENETRCKILGTLKKGIMLLRVWQQHDKTYFDQDNFVYQLWLARIETDMMKLDLTDLERECVLELIGKNDQTNDVVAETENEDDEYWKIISSEYKMLFAEIR